MNSFIYLAPVAGVIALIFAFYKAMTINKSEAGNDRMKEIASAIAEGARAFLFAEYKVLVIFVAVLFVVLGLGLLGVAGLYVITGDADVLFGFSLLLSWSIILNFGRLFWHDSSYKG